MQYEKFYAGPGFIVTNYSYLNAPWAALDAKVDGILGSYETPADPKVRKPQG